MSCMILVWWKSFINFFSLPDHSPQRRRVRSAEQHTASQMESGEQQRQRGVCALHLLPGASYQQGCCEQRCWVRIYICWVFDLHEVGTKTWTFSFKPQAGWKPAKAARYVADDVCGPKEPFILAVPDERHPHHQHLERQHGKKKNKFKNSFLKTKLSSIKDLLS